MYCKKLPVRQIHTSASDTVLFIVPVVDCQSFVLDQNWNDRSLSET